MDTTPYQQIMATGDQPSSDPTPYQQLVSSDATQSQASSRYTPYQQVIQGVDESGNPDFTHAPEDVRKASEVTGKHDYDGLCEQFVEDMAYGSSGMYPTAVSAWNNYVNNGKARGGLQNIQPGDLLYFAPDGSNQNAGHTAIYVGGNKMISATYGGVRMDDLNDWAQSTGQQLLGNVSPQ